MDNQTAPETWQSKVEELETAYTQAVAYSQGLEEEVAKYKKTEADLERRIAQLALMNGIGRKITSTLDLEDLLNTTVHLLQEIFGYDHVALYLLEGNHAKLRAIAGSFKSLVSADYSQPLDKGVIGRVATQAKKMVVNDVTAEPVYLLITPEATSIQAELCLPITQNNRTFGILDVQSSRLNAFSHNDVTALEILASYIAVAIEKARLYQAAQRELTERKQAEAALQQASRELNFWIDEKAPDLLRANEVLQAQIAERFRAEIELQTRVRQQAAVSKFGQRALSGTDLTTLMKEAVGLIIETLEVEYCQILELLSYDDTLLLRAGTGHLDNPKEEVTMSADSSSQLGYTLLSSEPVVVEDLSQETRFTGPQVLLDYKVISSMSVIIDADDWPFGVLAVYTTRRRTFNQDDINFLQAMANILAQAHQRKTTEDALRESEERYRRLLEISFETIAIYSENELVYIDPSGAKLYGVDTVEQLIGRPVTDFIEPGHLKIIEMSERQAEGKGWEMPLVEQEIIRFDGTRAVVEMAGIPITYQGRAAMLMVIRDISQRKWAEAELNTRAYQQAVVAKFGQRALAESDLTDLLDDAVSLIAETLHVEYCQILELLPLTDTLLLRAGVGWQEGLVGSVKISADATSQIGYTLLSSNPVIVEDIRVETRFTPPPLLKDHQVVSGMSVIIDRENWPFGVLGVHTTKKRIFTEDDINFLQAMANILAQAIERRSAEQALRESEENFRTLAEKASDGILIAWGENGNIVYANKRMGEIVDYTIAELCKFRLKELVRSDEIKKVLGRYRNILADNVTVPNQYDTVFIQRTGGEVPVELAVAQTIWHGQPAGLAIIRDITTRERAEKALRESEEKYRTLIEQSGDAIFLIYGGRFEVINHRFAEMFGVTQEEANAPSFAFTNIVAPKSRDIIKKLSPAGNAGKQGRPRYEFTALDKNGNEIEVELTVSYPFYKRGLATQGIIRDITERKRIEREKRIAYQQVQQYAAEVSAKIKEVERQREISNILAEVVASVSLTLPPKEILNNILLKLQQLIPYDSAAIFLAKDNYLIMEAARGFKTDIVNQKYTFEQNALFLEMKAEKSYILVSDTRVDDRYQFWVGAENVKCWIGAPLLVAQEVIGYLTVDGYEMNAFTASDANLVQAFAHQVAQTIYNSRLFSDLKTAQNQLIQRERLAALGQMAATVAHELRNPLMAIKMGVEYLLHGVPKDDPRQQGAALMQTNMDRINRIVEDILYVSRAPKPNLIPGLLRVVLENEMVHWQLRFAEKKIKCHTQLAHNLPAIMLDADQMGRALSNLIGNSVDVLGSEGEIHLTLSVENGYQIITLVDNGPGIPEENQARIFEPFFTTKSRGTGLGLSIVKQIITYHHGEIKVWSSIGVGTKFTISLPQIEEM